MSEQLKESLSAAMDGEADAFELRRVLDEAKVNDELREQWHRYQLLGDHIRGESAVVKPGLREAIWAELDSTAEDNTADVAEVEFTQQAQTGTADRPSWIGRVTGLAVAASVAFLVVVNGGVFEDADVAGGVAQNDINEAIIDGKAGANDLDLIDGTNHQVPALRPVADDSDLRRHSSYVLSHAQNQAMHQPSLSGFSKILTYSKDEDPMPVAAETEAESQVDNSPE